MHISCAHKHEHTLWVININNRQCLYSWWFTATLPLQAKSARWIVDGLIWLSTIESGFKISKHTLHFSAGLLILFSLPPLPAFPREKACFSFFQALPLFTWFFVLGCHIISLSDDVASLRAHNEEVVVAHGLVPLHWGYHRMLGHSIVQVWTYLAVDRFILASMITVCIYLKQEYIFVFFSLQKNCAQN